MKEAVLHRNKKKSRMMTTTRIIMMGFLIAILLGTIGLMLPISTRSHESIGLYDALFVAVSSICVTGLSTVNIGQTFTVFGQVIILILIQLGGLGVVTFTTLVFLMLRRRITLSERMLIQNAYNLETLSGLVKLTMRIVKVTLAIEGLGAIGYAFVFVPKYGLKGIWFSIFHGISAFCNAGIDLLGGNSFTEYVTNPILNITTILLIIISGLGFPVYWELYRVWKEKGNKEKNHFYHKVNIQVKLVITMTVLLIVIGFLVTFIFEYHNPDSLGPLSLPNKIMAAMFQSVTLRTAGFATIDQSCFTDASSMVYLVLMFIGGSPAGTAGGVKTVTVALLLASMWANIRGRKDVVVFHRKISDDYIRRSVAIIVFSFSVLVVLGTLLLFVQQADFMDTMYEMTSAIATVGLSKGLTGELNNLSKVLVCAAMYLGRIGPITLALAFSSRRRSSEIKYPEAKVIVG